MTAHAIPILLVLAWFLLTCALGLFLWQCYQNPPQVREAEADIIYAPTVTLSASNSAQLVPPVPLEVGLYICDINFGFGSLKNDRHSEITICLLNRTLRVVDFVGVTGNIKFKAKNLNTGDPKMS